MIVDFLSKFQIWFDNVPHPKLVEYKKDQNWVRKSGDYLVFPGGGTQFKAGVTRYIQFIEQVDITVSPLSIFEQVKFAGKFLHLFDGQVCCAYLYVFLLVNFNANVQYFHFVILRLVG